MILVSDWFIFNLQVVLVFFSLIYINFLVRYFYVNTFSCIKWNKIKLHWKTKKKKKMNNITLKKKKQQKVTKWISFWGKELYWISFKKSKKKGEIRTKNSTSVFSPNDLDVALNEEFNTTRSSDKIDRIYVYRVLKPTKELWSETVFKISILPSGRHLFFFLDFIHLYTYTQINFHLKIIYRGK